MLGQNQNHCRRPNCRCTHTDGCERGFISVIYVDEKVRYVNGEKKTVRTQYDGVEFCEVCDPERAYIQKTSKSSEELAERLRARSSYKSAENYERTEASKTRTL